MITNLFSIFDPSTNWINFPINWLRTFLGLIFIPISFWMLPSRFSNIWNNLTLTLHKEFKILIGNSTPQGTSLILISFFTIIFFNNLLGIFPYIFTRTSHLTMSLRLTFPLWITLIIYGWFNNTNHMFIHLIPQGTPYILIPFIVLIETISNIIRPLTLAVRLTANIIAGHLLLTLLGNTGPSLSFILLIILLIRQILLLTLEFAVAIIQSYVFTILRTLYSSEIN